MLLKTDRSVRTTKGLELALLKRIAYLEELSEELLQEDIRAVYSEEGYSFGELETELRLLKKSYRRYSRQSEKVEEARRLLDTDTRRKARGSGGY